MADFRKNNRSKHKSFNRSPFRKNRDVSCDNPNVECITLRIEKMVQGGEGLARLDDGRVCFVAGALPGELCKVRLTSQKKDFTRGEVLEVLEASPDRVTPKCPLYGKCGGCSLQHLSSEKQAEYLEKVERENFRRMAHAELPDDFVIHTGNAWGYRNRARVVYRKNPDGRCFFGFRGEESNVVVPFKKCPVLTDALNDFLCGPAAQLLEEGQRYEGGMRRSKFAQEVDVNVFDNGDGQVSFYYPGMSQTEISTKSVSVVEMDGRKIKADASVFFQSNLGLLPKLIESVRKAVDEGLASGKSTDGWLIDLFSGVGFFACILQDKFKRITTVERDEGCLEYAKFNLSKTSRADARLDDICGDEACGFKNSLTHSEIENVNAPAEDWLLKNVVDVPATLIVDPPRTGLPKEALNAIAKSSVNRLIYVSCNPVTLARDYAKLAEAKFTLSHAEGFAFYPQTSHFEMMFVLDR